MINNLLSAPIVIICGYGNRTYSRRSSIPSGIKVLCYIADFKVAVVELYVKLVELDE